MSLKKTERRIRMSEKEADKEERSFWDIVCNFFKGIGLKVKLILGAVLGIFGFIKSKL